MGQTLTHGIYLPDEGERNCYSGLAANWQILDGSVGTIAAHTAALAGKAPLVHTHTKSDITDFPAYGTTAGTICEGNDSRLSDARTPVAHTHSKSDVTDLLNSNFIPSANNSYDLGSSSYQWNNFYAKKVNTQSVNGVNPGALSLPNIEASTNLAGDITDFTGATQLSLNSGSIGWVYIQIPNVQGDYIEVQIGNSASIRYFVSAGYSDSLDSIEVLVPKPPVVTKVRVKATGGAVSKALFYPCLGNV